MILYYNNIVYVCACVVAEVGYYESDEIGIPPLILFKIINPLITIYNYHLFKLGHVTPIS